MKNKLRSKIISTESYDIKKKYKKPKNELLIKKKGNKKLQEFYKLELQNAKKENVINKKKSDDYLINDDYCNIKEISLLVKEQTNLYNSLLRTRVLTQKVLLLANKLPLLSFVALNDKLLKKKKLNINKKNILKEIKLHEENVKNNITELLSKLYNILINSFIKCNVPINENAIDEINIICDENDKIFYENRRKLYKQNSLKNEKKLFSTIDTWYNYSKNTCLNYFDILHKLIRIRSEKTLKTFEHSISSQINQIMFDMPIMLENSYPQNLDYKLIGKELYNLIYKDDSNFNLNKYIYDDEAFYKKFLLNTIQILKDNQEDNELLNSQRKIYKIKKKYENDNKKNGKNISFEPIPELVNFMIPEKNDIQNDDTFDYMDNDGFVDVILSSLFQL